MRTIRIEDLCGHLDIFSADCQDEFEGTTERWREVQIHGDPDGLRSLARLLLELADLDQASCADLPKGARSHVHLRPGRELSKSSDPAIVGRLDANGTRRSFDRFSPR